MINSKIMPGNMGATPSERIGNGVSLFYEKFFLKHSLSPLRGCRSFTWNKGSNLVGPRRVTSVPGGGV